MPNERTGEIPVVAVTAGVSGESRQAIASILGEMARVVFTEDEPRSRSEALRQAVAVIGSRLGAELPPNELGAAANLRLIQFVSAGVDHVDMTAIPTRIVVAGNAGAYARPMAEHALGMVLSLAKRLWLHREQLANGVFDHETQSISLEGAVCGVLGFGGIGRRTAELMRALGARIQAINTSGQTDERVDFVGTLADLDTVLAVADVLVISMPLTRRTQGLIGRRELGLMKPTAILVNVARGAIVDERALYERLRDEPEFSAGIDTWWHEPPMGERFRVDYPFFELPNLIGSPHDSAIVAGIGEVAARHAAENVARFLRGEAIAGVVDRSDYVA